ncbi:thioredoxin [Escherichia coli]|nr:thioredoxin [Escherichia coli]
MRGHNALLLAAAILISGAKDEKLSAGAPAPGWAELAWQSYAAGLEACASQGRLTNFAGCGARGATV